MSGESISKTMNNKQFALLVKKGLDPKNTFTYWLPHMDKPVLADE